MKSRNAAGFAADQRGTTAMEFALAGLPLFMLMLGIIESGLLFWSWQALQGAVTDAGRCAAIDAVACANVTTSQDATKTYAVSAAKLRGLSGLTTANVTITTGAAAQALCGNTTAAVGSIVMTYRFHMITFIPMPSNLTASACFPLSS
jgi:Flp pilus assembly protein TadG